MIARRTRLALVCAAGLFATTGRADPPDGTEVVPAHARATPKPASAFSGTIRGKPAAPIRIEHSLGAPPAAGRPLEVVLTLTPGVSLTDARLSLAASDGLALGAPGTGRYWPSLAANESVVVRVVVTPVTFDTHYLTVGVEGRGRDRWQGRSVMVPIRLVPEKVVPRAALKQDQHGRAIHPLPAVETTR